MEQNEYYTCYVDDLIKHYIEALSEGFVISRFRDNRTLGKFEGLIYIYCHCAF